MTTCYIIRHADKEKGDYYNPRLRHQDPPISSQGQREAQKLVPYFAVKPISSIYVSAYQRTLQTIACVAQDLRKPAIVDERLNEIDNGQIEGLADAEIQQAFPDTWKAFTERSADFRFPGGETGEEARQRITGFLAEKCQPPEVGSLILVSHDGLIRLLMCHLMNIPVYQRWNFQVDTCGIMEITWQLDFKTWKLVRFNQT